MRLFFLVARAALRGQGDAYFGDVAAVVVVDG
jgi:hypothetical protein